MISRPLFVGWSFLWWGVCLFCLLGSGSSETDTGAELLAQLNEILSNEQNDTYVYLFVIYCFLRTQPSCI